MKADINTLTSLRISDCFALREELPIIGAEEADFGIGKEGLSALIKKLSSETTCMTMLAGSGSRWVKSLNEAHAQGKYLEIDENAPRGLFPVANYMGIGPEIVPIASYSISAVNRLGKPVLVVRGWEEEIKREIFSLLPIKDCEFVTQESFKGKPRGHGDAAYQAMKTWKDSRYLIVNFGGDAGSPLSALSGLAAMAALETKYGNEAPGLIIPASYVKNPSYPISIDTNGLPTGFGHAKLQGKKINSVEFGYTNVGVRIYRTAILAEAIRSIRNDYWTEENGYNIPGNDPEGLEFALDNVDARLALAGMARILPVCRAEELSPVKSLADIDNFLTKIKIVCEDGKVIKQLL